MADNLAPLQAAKTSQELWAALNQLMTPLGDAGLRYAGERPGPLVARDAAAPPVEWLPGDVALVRLHHATSRNEDAALVAAQPGIVARARGVIVDVRPDGPAPVEERVVQQLAAQLIDNPVQLPAVRQRTHSGYRPQRIATSGDYHSSFEVVDSELLRPGRSARAVPLVFIVNNRRPLPLAALALQRRGQAWIVAQGSLSTAGLLPYRTVVIEDGVTVRFPAGELVYEDGTTGIHADATLPADQAAGADSPAVGLAIRLLGGAGRPAAREYQRLAPAPVRMIEKPYPEMQLPTLAWRQLAAIKLWAVGDAFFPYKDGMAQPWNDSLVRALRQMEGVDSPVDYAVTLQRMAATLQDSHVMMVSAALNKHLGLAAPEVRLGRVEGKIAVVSLDGGGAARQAGLLAGDVVLSVDGEEAEPRARRLADLLGGSTPAGRDRNGLQALLRGAEDKAAVLQVERGDGQVRTVSLARRRLAPTVRDPSATPYRLVDARIGYVDLDLLQPQQLDAMFDALGQTESLILDMRGYPKVLFHLIAERLNLRGVRPVATISRPVLSAGRNGSRREVHVQTTTMPKTAPYRGKLIMLINEHSQSRAEHSAMFFDAVAPLTFIGSPTAGANGDITDTILPGNIQLLFSGQEIRHADGRPLQRVGIQPHIPSAPTLAGLRAGRDDVLDRAIEFARTGK
jgi:C-terminal processing protease CtpA/Prc